MLAALTNTFHHLQFEKMDWVEELGEVGIEDVHRLDMVVPPVDVDTAISHMLPQLWSPGSRRRK